MVDDGSGDEYPMRAVFVEFAAPERLAWSEPDVEGGMTTSLTFTDLGDGRTEVVVHQTNVPEMYRSPEAQAGMQSSFDKFAAYVSTLARSSALSGYRRQRTDRQVTQPSSLTNSLMSTTTGW